MCPSFLQNYCTAQKIKFSIKDLFSKCDQILGTLRIWSYFVKKSWMQNFFFFALLFSIYGDFAQKFASFKGIVIFLYLFYNCKKLLLF